MLLARIRNMAGGMAGGILCVVVSDVHFMVCGIRFDSPISNGSFWKRLRVVKKLRALRGQVRPVAPRRGVG